MNRRRIVRNLAALGLIAAFGTGLLPNLREAQGAGPSAREIMDKVSLTRKLDGSEAVVKMIIVSEQGQTRERKITMATKLFDGGKTEKRIYRFLSPADVQGTGVLVFDYEKQADDVWIYLPALRKTRRIVSSQKSQSFMGSEFTYGDLNIPPLDDFNYNLVKEEDYGGESCFVVDILPKKPETGSEEGYSKKTFWVSKAKFAVRKGLFYDAGGALLKELKTDDIKLLDPKKNRYRAMKMEMTNKKNGRKSVFESEKVTLAPDTKDEFFTPRYLERP
jgi:outer membrane lipoprotein-sorting protein